MPKFQISGENRTGEKFEETFEDKDGVSCLMRFAQAFHEVQAEHGARFPDLVRFSFKLVEETTVES